MHCYSVHLYGYGRDPNRIFRCLKGVSMAVVRGGGGTSRSVSPPSLSVCLNEMCLYFLH